MSLIFQALSSSMDKSAFACGEADLDLYLKTQASQDMKRHFASVIVASEMTNPNIIIGYYTLCASSIVLNALPEAFTKKMPKYPLVPAIRPNIRLSRLAVHQEKQSQHIGSLLLLNALKRSCNNEMAWAIFLVDAKNESVVNFYKKFHFQPFVENTQHLWAHRKQVEKIVECL